MSKSTFLMGFLSLYLQIYVHSFKPTLKAMDGHAITKSSGSILTYRDLHTRTGDWDLGFGPGLDN